MLYSAFAASLSTPFTFVYNNRVIGWFDKKLNIN